MTKEEYLKALEELRISKVGAGVHLGISRRQAQRIAAGECPVPEPVAKLITFMLAFKS